MLLDLIGTNFKITNAKPTLCLCTHKTARSKQMPKHFLPNISKYNRLSSFYQLHKENNILQPKEKHLKTTHILVIKLKILCLSQWEYIVRPGIRVYIIWCHFMSVELQSCRISCRRTYQLIKERWNTVYKETFEKAALYLINDLLAFDILIAKLKPFPV